MRRSKIHHVVLPVCASALIIGCASVSNTSRPAGTASVDCAELDAALSAAEEQKRAATATQRDAWKVVIPFAVAARYISATASVSDADTRSAQLQAESDRHGCRRDTR